MTTRARVTSDDDDNNDNGKGKKPLLTVCFSSCCLLPLLTVSHSLLSFACTQQVHVDGKGMGGATTMMTARERVGRQ
jgi:hypothetical protein